MTSSTRGLRTCVVPRCRHATDLLYYGHEVCEVHWLQHCAGTLDLKAALKVAP